LAARQASTLDYLSGGGVGATAAAADLGGSSVQLARAPPPAAAAAATEGYVSVLSGGDRAHHIYVHSYLGYGLMAARAAVLQRVRPPLSDAVTYAYAGETVTASPASTASSAPACRAAAVGALRKNASCAPAPAEQCSFAGAWGGGGGPGAASFLASSYFWDRARQAGLVGAAATSASVRPAARKAVATRACTAPAGELAAAFSDAPTGAPDAQLFCLDVSYCHALLTAGFGLAEEAEVTLVKQVEYKGAAIEAAWPLGAAVNALG
jgi:apyrase